MNKLNEKGNVMIGFVVIVAIGFAVLYITVLAPAAHEITTVINTIP